MADRLLFDIFPCYPWCTSFSFFSFSSVKFLIVIQLQSDGKGIVSYLNRQPSSCDWRAKAILADVQNNFGSNSNLIINYVNRNQNGEADSLAKWSIAHKGVFLGTDDHHTMLQCKIIEGIVRRY